MPAPPAPDPSPDAFAAAASNRPESISAVTLGVADMARSVGFYEALGFRRLFGGPGERFTSYAVGESYLNLTTEAAPVGWWGRMIFHVPDVDRFHANAVAAGLSPQFPPRDAPWGERYFHLLDPDGHELSFARPLDR